MPWLHFTPRKDPVPILQEAGWAPGPVWTGGKSRPHRDSIPDHPVCSQSLYLLSYLAHTSKKRGNKMKDDEMGRAHVTYGQRKGGTEIHMGLRYRELNRPTGRPRFRQDGNIEVDCQYLR